MKKQKLDCNEKHIREVANIAAECAIDDYRRGSMRVNVFMQLIHSLFVLDEMYGPKPKKRRSKKASKKKRKSP